MNSLAGETIEIGDDPDDARRPRGVWLAIIGAVCFFFAVAWTSSGPLLPVMALVLSVGTCVAFISGRSWPAMTVVAVVVGLGLIAPGFSVGPREPSRKLQCLNNMRQIALALHMYHEQHGRFPPPYTVDDEGRRLHSWRVLLLPYLKQRALGERFKMDEPWDSPHNMAVAQEMPSLFRCSSGPLSNEDHRRMTTSYVAVLGGRSVWKPGGFTVDEIAGRTHETILFIEKPYGSQLWTDPNDPEFDRFFLLLPYLEIGKHQKEIHVAYADGRVSSLPLNSQSAGAIKRAISKGS